MRSRIIIEKFTMLVLYSWTSSDFEPKLSRFQSIQGCVLSCDFAGTVDAFRFEQTVQKQLSTASLLLLTW